MYVVEITAQFNARQGLHSPVRRHHNLPSLVPENGFETVLKVGIQFEDNQLTERGWFVDTDAVENVLKKYATYLESDVWTNLFETRPTYEYVAKWLFKQLEKEVPGLQYVELENLTINVTTRYSI